MLPRHVLVASVLAFALGRLDPISAAPWGRGTRDADPFAEARRLPQDSPTDEEVSHAYDSIWRQGRDVGNGKTPRPSRNHSRITIIHHTRRSHRPTLIPIAHKTSDSETIVPSSTQEPTRTSSMTSRAIETSETTVASTPSLVTKDQTTSTVPMPHTGPPLEPETTAPTRETSTETSTKPTPPPPSSTPTSIPPLPPKPSPPAPSPPQPPGPKPSPLPPLPPTGPLPPPPSTTSPPSTGPSIPPSPLPTTTTSTTEAPIPPPIHTRPPHRQTTEESSDSTITVIIVIIILLVVICLILGALYVLWYRPRQQKVHAQKAVLSAREVLAPAAVPETERKPASEHHRIPPPPKKPRSEFAPDHLKPESFKFIGPMRVPQYIVPVPEDDSTTGTSTTLGPEDHFEFDDNLNEVIEFGSEVEQVVDNNGNLVRGPKPRSRYANHLEEKARQTRNASGARRSRGPEASGNLRAIREQ